VTALFYGLERFLNIGIKDDGLRKGYLRGLEL